jgi:hypothetical protein
MRGMAYGKERRGGGLTGEVAAVLTRELSIAATSLFIGRIYSMHMTLWYIAINLVFSLSFNNGSFFHFNPLTCHVLQIYAPSDV